MPATRSKPETPEDDQLVASPAREVMFMARRANLRLVKEPQYYTYGANGNRLGTERGQSIAFQDGVLRIPAEGKVKLLDARDVDAGEMLEWLDAHWLNGDREDGFWRVDLPAPSVSPEEFERMMSIVADADVERLARLIAQERDGWGRDDLLKAAESALEKLKAKAAA